MLTSFVLYADEQYATGFEMTFTLYPAEEFTGWPQVTHLYGSKDGMTAQSLDLAQDL